MRLGKTMPRRSRRAAGRFFRATGAEKVSELGLALRSKNVSALAFWEKYHSLKGFLLEGSIDMAQSVTNMDSWAKR
jgi:hypothetical protein